MKKTPPIYGIGWTEQPSADVSSVTLSYVGTADEDVAVALAEAVGHRDSSASYPVDRDDAERIFGALPPGDVADLVADMQEDGCDIFIVFSADTAASEDPLVTMLRDMYDSGRADVAYGEAHWWPTDDTATDPYPLIELWAKRWPDSLPIAHELKELFEHQWVRLHSLPDSKRSAESDAEWDIVLARHNAVLDELATVGDDLIVIMSVVAPDAAPAEPDLDFWAAVPWHYADPDLLFAHLYVTTETWQRGDLDDLLQLAAEEQIGGVIIAPLDLRWLYHPYAGGADVILPSAADRDALGELHPTWRSTHLSGL